MSDNQEQRAAAIIDKVLSLPEADRSSAARAACQGNPALLERVQSLLSALPMMAGFMARPTAGADRGAPPFVAADTLAAAAVGEKPGDHIGPYKLLEQIGEGGFGVVFMAEQQRPVRRRVALKVIKLGMDTREVVARFEAERQALAMMDHPNIARVLDAGATATGRPYFVMELVRGSPVTEYADKHKLGTRERVGLAVQVCRAVQHAHGKGVIHRDLKPSNVLVTVADDRPIPKVIDFGIAKATQSPLTDRTLFTAHRQLIGTPQYMSPEQADSDGVDVDTRTDVYSLGVLLYELLVGTTPLDARSLRSAALDAMRKMIREVDPAKPSTKLNTLGETLASVAINRGTDPKQLSRQLHGELDWIVMRALEKDRSRRYETAAAMADDLNHYLSGEAVVAGPASGLYRLKKTLRRYKAAVVIGSAIAACLLLGVAGTTWGLIGEAHQRRLAESRRADAEAARDSAESVVNAMQLAARGRNAEAAPLFARAWEFARQRLGDMHPDSMKRLADYATDLIAGGDADKAQALYADAVARARLVRPADPVALAKLLSGQADALIRSGKKVQSIPMLREAVGLLRTSAPDDPDRGQTLFALGQVLLTDKNWPEAEAIFRENYAWDQKHPDPQRTPEPVSLRLLNVALKTQNKAIILPNADPRWIEATIKEAALQASGHHLSAAIADLRQIVDAVRGARPTDPALGLALFRLGRALILDGKYVQAEAVLREDWAWDLANSGPPDPDQVPLSLQQLNRCLMYEGKSPLPVIPAMALLLPKFQTEIDGKSSSADGLFARGGFRLGLGQFREAADDWGRCMPRRPQSTVDDYHDYMRLVVLIGDLPAYRRLCQEILQRFGSGDGNDRQAVVRNLLILPEAPADPDRLFKMLDYSDAHGGHGAWAMMTRCLLQYRLGHSAEALELARLVEKQLPVWGQSHARLVAAMSLQKLGRAAEARRALAVELRRAAEEPRAGVDFISNPYRIGYLDRELFIREAIALIGPVAPASRPVFPTTPGITVAIAHNRAADATPEFRLNGVPAVSPADEVPNAVYQLIGYTSDRSDLLHDGKLQTEPDDPANSFRFDDNSDGGRLQIDLQAPTVIRQVNTYSWHPAERAPQVYSLFASTGGSPDFNALPADDIDPATCGWTPIAHVDTHEKFGIEGGQYGVSISGPGGRLGTYRYLLLVISKGTPGDEYGNTFYGEIAVVGDRPPPGPVTRPN